MATLEWRESPDGVTFTVLNDGARVEADAWALLPDVSTQTGTRAHTPVLLALRDANYAETSAGDTEVLVPWSAVATLRASDLSGLGLPGVCPYSLRLDKHGLITDADFRVHATLVSTAGRPVVGAVRNGALLTIGGRRFTLLEPLFGVLEAADRLAGADVIGFDERGALLGELQERLPPDALADPYLRAIRVMRADTFSTLPKRLPNGELSFQVVPARERSFPADETPWPEEANEPLRVLPEAREEDWNRYIDKLESGRRCWPAGAGHYLVVSDEMKAAIPVLTAIRSGPECQRIAFLRNPRAALREHMGDRFSEEALEALFWESGEYGARVREVGLWQPKVLPFVKRTPQQWLPEAMGLRIGDHVAEYSREELLQLQGVLETAAARGDRQVVFKGQEIPVSSESLAAVAELLSEVEGGATPAPTEASEKIAVLIEDNLEALKFRRPKRTGGGVVGELPSCMSSSLFSFQLDGYRWLQQLWAAGAPGALLADDMGLGKTVQTLAFLAWLREGQSHREDNAPALIVGPTGLLRNWQAEHAKHLSDPGLGECLEVHGEGLRRLRPGGGKGNELVAGFATLDVARLQAADWVVTTYETLRDYQHSFAKVRWAVAVFDEAQKIKNPCALMTDAAKAVEAQFVITLTGTPVENHLADLWTIVDTAQPGRLGALKEFLRTYQPDDHDSAEQLAILKRELTEVDTPPLMLRRMKENCLSGLPAISFAVSRVPMPAAQADAYDKVVGTARRQQAKKAGMLSTLQALRAVSLHPDTDLPGSDDDFIRASARLTETVSVLDSVAAKKEKALVFVESLAMQSILAELLQRRYRLPSPPAIINGGVAGHRRKGRVDDFCGRRGFDVMILSPRAGGVGLTITAANHVIHLSRWWNPAVEDQATDRVYRIGQERPVQVYVPMAVHPVHGEASFDVRLDSLLQRKRALSRELLAPPTASEEDLNRLYTETIASR